jgi:hypothetical protein
MIDALVAALDLDVHTVGICHACLSFVSFALDDDDDGGVRARREARRMAPDLWDEGLEEPVLTALERARDEGISGAAAALLDARANGGRSDVVRAIVLRLAADLSTRTRREMAIEKRARARLELAPPELN